MQNEKINLIFYEKGAAIKITEAKRMNLHSVSWSVISDYYLESVKINNYYGKVKSTATLKISDISGQVSCIVRGPAIGLLFGLTREQWREVENMCVSGHQLFYRYFKSGLSNNYSFEQKLFYNFCLSNQMFIPLVIVFRRCPNLKNKDKHEAVLETLDLKKCDNTLLEQYVFSLREIVK